MAKMTTKCYMCESIATTREHVPPLCLFPESKDVFGHNFRKDLITVPSCEEHNSKKTKDDEFLMVSIAGIMGNNYLGYHHTITKINRAVRRKSADFLKKAILRNSKEKIVQLPSGNKYSFLYGTPDFKRLLNCFTHIAYGLYFHESGIQFNGQITVHLGFINYNEPNHNTFVKFLRRRFEVEDLALEEKGNNPHVFTYQYCKPDQLGIIALKLNFYSKTDVFIAYKPKGIETPYHIGLELINQGVPTIFTLGDEEFVFNKNRS